GRFAPFAVILTLGTLNKETIVFLLPAYLFAAWTRLPRRVWLTQALVLAAAFTLAYETPRIAYTRQHLPTVTTLPSEAIATEPELASPALHDHAPAVSQDVRSCPNEASNLRSPI
ncbi:MAG: hypothetical protein INR62_14160, partial [Rhodospirillales bacterium]|nr:hypothetical protein [Acetobacter sp.]